MKTLHTSMLILAVAALVSFTVGCGGKGTPKKSEPGKSKDKTSSEKDKKKGHAHGTGPHDGTLADWGGGKYHVEFTVSHDKKEATVYILGDDEKTTSPIKATEIDLSIKDPAMQVKLKAAPQEGDPAGSSSRFVGNHDSLGVVQEYEGTITGVVGGTPYSGNFKEEPHE